MKTYYREQKYVCGYDYIDIQIFPVYPSSGARRKKRKPTSEVQQRLNDENARKKLSRQVHTNFTKRDYALTLTYDEDLLPNDENEAKKDIQNFMRRAKRLYKKLGIDLKYIWIMEKSEKTGRIHFHTFMTGGADRTQIEELWRKGYANSKSLRFTKDGVEGLVVYSLKDKPLTYRRWSGSKNLKKPHTPRPSDFRITRARAKKLYAVQNDIRAFEDMYPDYRKYLKDYSISGIKAVYNEVNYEYYFSLRLYRTNFLNRSG